jgi:hypothetical protein
MPQLYRSVNSFARALGLGRTATARHLRRPGFPKPNGPWTDPDVEAAKRWIAQTVEPDKRTTEGQPQAPEKGSLSERLTLARIVKSTVEAQSTLLKLKERAGALHATDACRARRLKQIHATKSRLMMLVELTERIRSAASPPEARQILADEVRAICEEFAAGLMRDT